MNTDHLEHGLRVTMVGLLGNTMLAVIKVASMSTTTSPPSACDAVNDATCARAAARADRSADTQPAESGHQ